MPAQKHNQEEAIEEYNELQKYENQDVPEGPDGSDSPSQENNDDEYLAINLAEIRKDVQCPICLGIIRKTRTVMECLHRFCKECIDKSIRLGNNECPACRTHCASRRSLRDDPNYDALIAAIYPDIDKYEEEEMALHDEEKTRNKELQDSIARTLRRQTVAQGRKHTRSKAKATASLARSQSNFRSVGVRRRQSYLNHEHRGYDDNEDEEDNSYSSADERFAEIGSTRSNTRIRVHFPHPSGSNASGDGGRHETDSEVGRECISTTPALLERLTWGSSGLRSRGSIAKDTHKSPDSNLMDHLQNSADDESGICLKLVPFDAHELPNLQQLHICCRPTLSVRQLREYVAFQNALETKDIEIYTVQGLDPNLDISTGGSFSFSGFGDIDQRKHKIQVIQEHETLAGIQSTCASGRGPLILVYRKKLPNSGH